MRAIPSIPRPKDHADQLFSDLKRATRASGEVRSRPWAGNRSSFCGSAPISFETFSGTNPSVTKKSAHPFPGAAAAVFCRGFLFRVSHRKRPQACRSRHAGIDRRSIAEKFFAPLHESGGELARADHVERGERRVKLSQHGGSAVDAAGRSIASAFYCSAMRSEKITPPPRCSYFKPWRLNSLGWRAIWP